MFGFYFLYNCLFSLLFIHMSISKKDIQIWLDEHQIKSYYITHKNESFIVNVEGSVHLKKMNLQSLPTQFQFGRIKGDFDCSQNQISSLKGGPVRVDGEYNASNNLLASYEFMPKKVGSLILNHNQLTYLSTFECFIEEDFYLFSNPIETITGFPQFSSQGSIILDKHFPFLAQYIENTQNKNYKMLTIDAQQLITYFENFILNQRVSHDTNDMKVETKNKVKI